MRIPQHERALRCTSCHQTIIVGGYVDDLDPATYRGVVCGCRQPLEPRAVELAQTIARARKAQTGLL